MLTLSQISKSFSGRTLFEDVSLQVNRGDRIGLVGPNGAGKSTLLSIILKEDSPDSGQVSWEKGANYGFLPQESAPVGEETVLHLACAVTKEIAEAMRIMANTPEDSEEHHEAMGVFSEEDGWQVEARAKQILKGLAFRESDFDRPARTLSGGWIMRAHLARLLVQQPDLLLLDEPTNHLDLESLGWFQEHLRLYRGAIMVISHDREFLNVLVSSVVELGRGRLSRYRGNYDEYLVQKAARSEQQMAAYKNQQKEIQSLQTFADRFRAKASKAAQAQSKLKQIERMEKIDAPEGDEKTVGQFKFPQPPRAGQKVVTLTDIDFAYGELQIYNGMNFMAERGQRTVLVGPNGAGKSTLLKLLGGVLEPQKGERVLGYQVRVGYFSQHRTEMLKMTASVLEAAMENAPFGVSEQMVRGLLGAFLFRGDDVFKPVAVLSGGEKTRLALVKILLDPPNLLLMDEPTTHLDIGSIDALIGALKQYEGTLIFISHDVHFIRSLAETVLHISAGQLTPYAGNYDYYLEKTKATSARAALTAGEKLSDKRAGKEVAPKVEAPTQGMKAQRENKKAEAAERNARAKEQRDREKAVANAEARILELEKKQALLTKDLEDPASYQDAGRAVQLNRELLAVQQELEAATAKWEALASELAANVEA
ncbi:MAG: ABC-F family ATP-binding cassette domain-containing protein [Verrucomicrobiota bacterium]